LPKQIAKSCWLLCPCWWRNDRVSRQSINSSDGIVFILSRKIKLSSPQTSNSSCYYWTSRPAKATDDSFSMAQDGVILQENTTVAGPKYQFLIHMVLFIFYIILLIIFHAPTSSC